MNYPYECPELHQFEVVKSVRNIDDPENCPTCGKLSTRYIALSHFYGASDWDKQEYNPGLGMVTRNSKHRAREAKARGLIEIGSEDCDKICNAQDKKLEDADNERHEKAMEPVVYGINEALRKSK